MTEHTPGPWCILDDGLGIVSAWVGIAHCSASRDDGSSDPNEARANAAFIVRACNAYHDLVAACSLGLTQMEKACFCEEGKPYDPQNGYCDIWEAKKAARAALPKAGEGVQA